MTPEERAGIARAVAEAIGGARADILRQCDERIAAQRQAHEAQLAEVQRSAAAEVATLRDGLADARHRAEMDGKELQVLRAVVEADPLSAAMFDAAGALQIVQRTGARLAVQLPDVEQLVRVAVEAMREQITAEVTAQAHAAIARSVEQYLNAPAWTPAAVYTEGQVVQHHIGRTYRVRQGVRASMGQEPGEHPEQWERLGTGGFRVVKSRPEAPQSGDVFTEHDARFMHDGTATILLVPKGAKGSDIERAVKGPHGLAQTAMAQVQDVAARLQDLQQAVQRNTAVANDGAANGAQALGEAEQLRADIDALRQQLGEMLAMLKGAA